MSLDAYRLTNWISSNPALFRALVLGLALAAALIAALVNPGIAAACPTGGGGSCGG